MYLNHFSTSEETIEINLTKLKYICLCKSETLPLHFGSIRTKGNPMTYFLFHSDPHYINLARQLADLKRNFHSTHYTILQRMILREKDVDRTNEWDKS